MSEDVPGMDQRDGSLREILGWDTSGETSYIYLVPA